MPLTFVLQWIFALPLFAVPVFSLRVGTERAGSRYHLAAWRVVGAAFAVFAVCLFGQLAYATAAMIGGEGSWIYSQYLHSRPWLEHSRTFLMVGAALGLLVMALARQEPGRGFGLVAAALVAAGLLAGAAGGVVEGGFLISAHYHSVVLTDAAELLVLLVTLFILLVSNRVDRYLWSMLAVYASSVALGIFWMAVVAQSADPTAWQPPNWSLSALRTVLYGTMAFIAYRRWRAGRGGRPMSGMLGQDRIQLSPVV
ncbi:MAG TPA: hypothetical protein VF771_12560 [Longimicrobiaceae bacterium]